MSLTFPWSPEITGSLNVVISVGFFSLSLAPSLGLACHQKHKKYYWNEQSAYDGGFQSGPKIQTTKEAMVQLYHSRDRESAGAPTKTWGWGSASTACFPGRVPCWKEFGFSQGTKLAITGVLAEGQHTNAQTNLRIETLQASANRRVNFRGTPQSSSQHFLLVFKATT